MSKTPEELLTDFNKAMSDTIHAIQTRPDFAEEALLTFAESYMRSAVNKTGLAPLLGVSPQGVITWVKDTDKHIPMANVIYYLPPEVKKITERKKESIAAKKEAKKVRDSMGRKEWDGHKKAKTT